MEHIFLDGWIKRSGLSKSYVASASGVSRSTIHRIQHGETDPTLGTLRELAIACGLDLDLQVRPLSDPFAAQAARMLLEQGFEPDSLAEANQWVNRLHRLGLQDPVAVIDYAGRASGLLALGAPSVYLRGDIDTLRLASAGDATGARWALSGQPHLELGAGRAVAGVKVLWAEEPRLAASLLADTLKEARSPHTATVVVAAALPAVFHASFKSGGLNYVAPIQALIDGFSLGGQLAGVAATIAKEW
ncbi:helix-turn-helix domain-containing protein [Arthrobacter sp. A2-55]|uniref:helix-turn-helix domain-containing protein n=1 Tax=Arthrobacter sp. A2-55 TaxID=2897337 RepID=UPI0021CD3DFC|nr:helix-turn-helix transcriptional regulator [Arthrobacter sp. A2-55]MCU6481296.1 helix-turn-helix domain-containing protein [Arthrobacter sp. A2-55]